MRSAGSSAISTRNSTAWLSGLVKVMVVEGRTAVGPPLGAHNREVYASVGVGDAELDALAREGVV